MFLLILSKFRIVHVWMQGGWSQVAKLVSVNRKNVLKNLREHSVPLGHGNLVLEAQFPVAVTKLISHIIHTAI